MSKMKDIGFLLLVILTSVSAMYEVVQSETDGEKNFPIISQDVGVDKIDEFATTTLEAEAAAFGESISIKNAVESAKRLDVLGLIGAVIGGLELIWGIFSKMLAWTNVVTAIFETVGLAEIAIIFIAPLAIIQILAGFYFLRDIVNTIRGVG